MQQGNLSNAKSAGSGLFEYRMDFGPGDPVYFGKDGNSLIILLGGGTKKRQQKDIEAARALRHEYKQRKRQETWSDGPDTRLQRDDPGSR